MYSITNFGAMIADRTRMHAFAEAMRRVITPGSVVIDLGAGPALFALLACRFGARRVPAAAAGLCGADGTAVGPFGSVQTAGF